MLNICGKSNLDVAFEKSQRMNKQTVQQTRVISSDQYFLAEVMIIIALA